MSTGFYTAAAGMFMQQRSLNVIANNMSNSATPGFKAERVVSTTFEQEYLIRKEKYKETFIGTGDAVRVVEDVPTLYDESFVKATGRPFDMAIQGEGYFVVQTGEEQQYFTRNGQFDIDEEGYLVLPGAGRIQGSKGDIKVDDAYFTVEIDGTVKNSRGSSVGQLLIVSTTENGVLEKFANGLYQYPGGNAILGETEGLFEVDNPTVTQGAIEASNTNMNREMTLMMETQRTFQSCSRALMMIDEIDQKTMNIAAL